MLRDLFFTSSLSKKEKKNDVYVKKKKKKAKKSVLDMEAKVDLSFLQALEYPGALW